MIEEGPRVGENISVYSFVFIQKLMQRNVRLQGFLRKFRFKTDTYDVFTFLSENGPLRKAISKFVPIPSSKHKRTEVCPICSSSFGGVDKDTSRECRAEIPTPQPFSTYVLVLVLTWALDQFFLSLSTKVERGSGSVVRQTDAYGRIIRIISGLISTVCSRVKIKIATRSIFGSQDCIVAKIQRLYC